MRPELSLLHVPFFLLLCASGITGFIAAMEILHRIAQAAILQKLLFAICLLVTSAMLMLVAYLIWISMGTYFLMSLPMMVFILVVSLPTSPISRRIDAIGMGRMLFVSLLVAFLSFAAALGYLILLTQLGFTGRIRLI